MQSFNPLAEPFIPFTMPADIFQEFSTTNENYRKFHNVCDPGYTFVNCSECMFCKKPVGKQDKNAYNVPHQIGYSSVGGVWVCCGESECKQRMVQSTVASAIADYHYPCSPYVGTVVKYNPPERPDIKTEWVIMGVRLSKSVYPAKSIFVLRSKDYKYTGHMLIPDDFDKTCPALPQDIEDVLDFYKAIAVEYPVNLRQYFPSFVLRT